MEATIIVLLPNELIYAFISKLDGASVVSLARTCKAFRRYCQDMNLWKSLCETEFPNVPIERFMGNYRVCWKYSQNTQTKNDSVGQLIDNIVNKHERYQNLKELRTMLCWTFEKPKIPGSTLSVLLAIFKDGTVDEKIESVRCIANMAANTAPKSCKFTEFAKYLIAIITTESNQTLLVDTLNTIRNIAGDGIYNRDFLLNQNSLPPIVALMKREIQQKSECSVKMLNAAAMAVTALCRGNPAPPKAKVEIVLPVLKELLNYQDEELLGNTLWAYSAVTEQKSSKLLINAVAKQNIATRLIELVQSPSNHVFYPAMRVIGNILVSDTEEHTVMFLCKEVFNVLGKFLHHQQLAMRKEAIWALSNIAATSARCIQAIINHGLVPLIIKKMGEDDAFVRKEAAFTIGNIMWKGAPSQVREIVKDGFMPQMVALAQTPGVSEEVLEVVLGALDNLLKPEIPAEDRIEYASMIDYCAKKFLQEVGSICASAIVVNMSYNLLQKVQ